jgi:hypothetical protein
MHEFHGYLETKLEESMFRVMSFFCLKNKEENVSLMVHRLMRVYARSISIAPIDEYSAQSAAPGRITCVFRCILHPKATIRGTRATIRRRFGEPLIDRIVF